LSAAPSGGEPGTIGSSMSSVSGPTTPRVTVRAPVARSCARITSWSCSLKKVTSSFRKRAASIPVSNTRAFVPSLLEAGQASVPRTISSGSLAWHWGAASVS
jgi:hypothetical protein